MQIIPFLLLLLFFGLLITIIIKVKVELVERLSLSYLLGIGFFTFFVFVFDLVFNIDYAINNTFSLLTSLCAILFVIKYKDTLEFFRSIKFVKKPLKWQAILFWSFVLLIFVYTLVINLYWPVYDWDALALYDFRPRVFMTDPNLTHATLSNGYFLGYPLSTSLAHLFVYQMGLESPKFIYSLIYLSFICIFYFSLRKSVSMNKAIFFSVILSLIPDIFFHATVAYTNLAYTVYLCTGVFYLYNWITTKEYPDLILASILIGLSCWIRSAEPFWLVPFAVVLVVSFKNKKISGIIYYLISVLAFYLPWRFFMRYISRLSQPLSASASASGPDYLFLLKMVSLERAFLVLDFLYKNVFSSWGLVLLLFVFATIRASINRKKNVNNIFLYITFMFLAFLYVGTFVFSIIYPGWQHIPDSARRMSMFILPLIVYSIALSYNSENL